MAGFSRTDWYEKNWGTVPGKPDKKGATLKGLLIISTILLYAMDVGSPANSTFSIWILYLEMKILF